MSKEYNSTLQARVEQFLKDKGISQAKAAPMMGISQTALSQYRRSMYDNGDIAALESKLEEFFRTQEEQQASTERAMPYRPTQDYIPTSISEDVCKLIRYCQIEKGMVIIHGDAGIGKTKGAEKFVRENPAASVYIQATPSIGTLGNLLKVVARALKVPESRNKLDLMLSIREKLEGTNKVIIIDEAQHLQLRALEEIRERYGFETAAIVTMGEVVEHLYNRPYKGQIYIDDATKAAIEAYYRTYGAGELALK